MNISHAISDKSLVNQTFKNIPRSVIWQPFSFPSQRPPLSFGYLILYHRNHYEEGKKICDIHTKRQTKYKMKMENTPSLLSMPATPFGRVGPSSIIANDAIIVI